MFSEEKAGWGLQDGFEGRRWESERPAPFTAGSGRSIVTANAWNYIAPLLEDFGSFRLCAMRYLHFKTLLHIVRLYLTMRFGS